MLTVRIIGLRGDEDIFECTRVMRFKDDTIDQKSGLVLCGATSEWAENGQWFIPEPDVGVISVYVMNDNGSTVSRYTLGKRGVGIEAPLPEESAVA